MHSEHVQRKQCKRWDIEGHAHFLTFSCFRNQPFLRTDRVCTWFAEIIDTARNKHPFDLWGYVFMPDHAHLLLLPKPGTKVSRNLYSLKLPLTRRVVAWARRNQPRFLAEMAHQQSNGKITHRFWQRGGGHDRNIWSAEEAHEKLRYIHGNPVRRGLVERPEEWLWSSARVRSENADPVLRIDQESFPTLLK